MRKPWYLTLLMLCGCSANHLHTAFLTEVCFKPFYRYQYHTCNDIRFVVDETEFTIPKGFKTDLASIPKIAWPFMAPAHSSLIRPAIVHDWLYRETCVYNRKQTDLIFYHMLRNDGVPKIRSSIMYYTVRIFGWKFYTERYCE